MGGFAWVTLATNDSYSLGALVLAHSLRRVGTKHELVVMVTPGVTEVMREKLSGVFNLVQEVNVLDSKDEANLALLARPELGITFTKLHCWRLTQYDKCVFIDADALVIRNCDELFEREELSAAPDVGWPDCFNSGVFVFKPSQQTFASITAFAASKGSFDGGDQGLLNMYFSDWAHKDISKHLPFIYNMCSTATYSYLPAFKQFGDDVRIIHFIGITKPWLQYFDTLTGVVQPPPGSGHLQPLLQIWWNIFCENVHSQLSPVMASSTLAPIWHKFTFQLPAPPQSYQPHQTHPLPSYPVYHEPNDETYLDYRPTSPKEPDFSEFKDPWENFQHNNDYLDMRQSNQSQQYYVDCAECRHEYAHQYQQQQRNNDSEYIPPDNQYQQEAEVKVFQEHNWQGQQHISDYDKNHEVNCSNRQQGNNEVKQEPQPQQHSYSHHVEQHKNYWDAEKYGDEQSRSYQESQNHRVQEEHRHDNQQEHAQHHNFNVPQYHHQEHHHDHHNQDHHHHHQQEHHHHQEHHHRQEHHDQHHQQEHHHHHYHHQEHHHRQEHHDQHHQQEHHHHHYHHQEHHHRQEHHDQHHQQEQHHHHHHHQEHHYQHHQQEDHHHHQEHNHHHHDQEHQKHHQEHHHQYQQQEHHHHHNQDHHHHQQEHQNHHHHHHEQQEHQYSHNHSTNLHYQESHQVHNHPSNEHHTTTHCSNTCQENYWHNEHNKHLQTDTPIHSDSHESNLSCTDPKRLATQSDTTIGNQLESEDAGLAGALAKLTLGEARNPEQVALEEHMRKQSWEQGQIDYMGRDSFDNIWKKICETLSSVTGSQKTPEKDPSTSEVPKEPKEVASAPSVESKAEAAVESSPVVIN
ncbi:signal transducer and activator of transcription C isoform X4 [Cephus cinctus]|uniref:glycogenin glucosyltransferase n=1 Tax=Cephus cinctus TaxID=211228 RepID=A0AAJ7W1T1_CEPCN|nr:signal transducer and activator of transcription C isoform X4 [Cephus cinctus]